jgi:hypothetical protein
MDCLENYGNPIFDTCSDVSNEEIANFEPLGQPNIVGENAKKLHDNFQPYVSINNADFGCHIEHIHVDLFQPCTFTSREDLL